MIHVKSLNNTQMTTSIKCHMSKVGIIIKSQLIQVKSVNNSQMTAVKIKVAD